MADSAVESKVSKYVLKNAPYGEEKFVIEGETLLFMQKTDSFMGQILQNYSITQVSTMRTTKKFFGKTMRNICRSSVTATTPRRY